MTGIDDLKLCIPYPSDIPRARGINAVHRSNKLIVDCQQEELDAIAEAACKVGLTRSAYTRWVMHYASLEILR